MAYEPVNRQSLRKLIKTIKNELKQDRQEDNMLAQCRNVGLLTSVTSLYTKYGEVSSYKIH